MTKFHFTIIREDGVDYDSEGNKTADWGWTVIDGEGKVLAESLANIDDALETIQIACLTE